MTDTEIFQNEIACIKRRSAGECNGGTDCNTCDLLMNEGDIIAAYTRAINNINLINQQRSESIKEFIKKMKSDLKYYLDTNEENGVVYIPKFVVEKRLKEMTEVCKG